MRTATRYRRTIQRRPRPVRPVRKRSTRRHQSRRRLVAVVLTGLALIGLVVVYLATRSQAGCFEAVGADKSGSQKGPAVIDRWSGEVDAIVGWAAACKGVVFAEAIYAQPGKGEVRRIPLSVSAINRFQEQQLLRKRIPEAKAAVEEVLNRPAGGGTNLIAWFHSVEAHLEGIPGEPVVNAALFTDGINSVEPVNMLKTDLSSEGVAALIARIRPDLPNCSNWRIQMLGVNTTADGGVDPRLAQGAERFWRAFVGACGGTLVRYDTAAKAA
jgi:hypothetical protein